MVFVCNCNGGLPRRRAGECAQSFCESARETGQTITPKKDWMKVYVAAMDGQTPCCGRCGPELIEIIKNTVTPP